MVQRTHREKPPTRERAHWILRFLHAPDSYGDNGTPIFGRTRLQKSMFLIHKRLEERCGRQTAFNFRPDKYGPFDPDIYSAVTFLEKEGYLNADDPEDHSEEYDLVRYSLTDPKGVEKAQKLYDELPEEQREVIDGVKQKHGFQKLGRLLTYVYNQYPDMTVNSELV